MNSVVATKQHCKYSVRVDDCTAKLAIIANNVNSFHVDDLAAKQECIPVRCVQGGLCPGGLCQTGSDIIQRPYCDYVNRMTDRLV